MVRACGLSHEGLSGMNRDLVDESMVNIAGGIHQVLRFEISTDQIPR
jgi:hypothetical protein